MELPTLTDPMQLAWLALLLPLLWWLAQPPKPKQVHWTAHLPQWLRAEATIRRRPPRFRAVRWLLLALAVTAVVCAKAAPVAQGRSGPDRKSTRLNSRHSSVSRMPSSA